MKSLPLLLAAAALAAGCAQNRISEEPHGTYTLVRQTQGPTLGYSPASGLQILTVDGYAFKDLNRNGHLDPYEDWRLPFSERARDLAAQLSVEEMAGLMLYSPQQKLLDSTITEAQMKFIAEDKVRHVLVGVVAGPRVAAVWSNAMQAFCEGVDHGIPANNSSDPRNYNETDSEYNSGSGGHISRWPREIGMGATFDMEVVKRHAEVVSAEYRALGITTALSPQVDPATEPRWRRFYGTFSEDPHLNADIARVYCDGFQTSPRDLEIADGWGYGSINCMVKHWPGGGAEEAGRDAHYAYGKYAVYPGNNFAQHLIPFVEGAFNLPGKTRKAAAVMPYYTISWGQDPSGQNVGNSYSRYIITDLLRDKYGYDGVVCTDWGITHDYPSLYSSQGKPWGVEDLTVPERHLRILEAGVDQFGGNREAAPVLEAYRLWAEKYGEESARERFELSARRLLLNIFHVGVFENPYVDPDETERIVACEEFMQAGYDAQLKSVVMLKNHEGALPVKGPAKVYLPKRHFQGNKRFAAKYDYSMDSTTVAAYFTVTDDPAEADFALLRITSIDPHKGFSVEDWEAGGTGYVPISLQYRDYTAEYAPSERIAGVDSLDRGDRIYQGKTVHADNASDLDLVLDTRVAMGDKPVVVAVQVHRPLVMAEFEPSVDAILCMFGADERCILDIVSGRFEPYGLLPCQMPADMRTVEEQFPDVPGDMRCLVDADGHSYDFAYGLDWSGVINDARTRRYARR